MNLIDAPLRVLFDMLLYPFRTLPPLVGLCVVSLIAGVGMLLIFKVTSNQEKLDAVKRKIHAGLFEIRLFNDDIRAILRAQFEVLGHNLTYLRLTLIPMLWVIVPLFLVVAQLQFHYGYTGLEPGETTLLKVQLHPDWRDGTTEATPGHPGRPAIALDIPPGLSVEKPGLWIPASNEMDWRLSAVAEGEYEIGVTLGGITYPKSVRVSDAVTRRSPVKPSSFVEQLIYPAEPPLPATGPIDAIRLNYPEGAIHVFGWSVHWLIVFFVLSTAFAFALKNRLGVTI
ncbi:MAG: hypothetical protein ACE5IK_03880 [Acidobacteriota bacterium]